MSFEAGKYVFTVRILKEISILWFITFVPEDTFGDLFRVMGTPRFSTQMIVKPRLVTFN